MTGVTIIGGGIAGLSAAWHLSNALPDLEITVHESSAQWGGKLHSSEFGEFGRIDEGADAFLARVPEGVELCRELGIDGSLTSPQTSRAYVWSRGALRPIPSGVVLGVPTSIRSLWRSGVLPASGVFRAAMEPIVARQAAKVAATDSIGQAITARFGHHVTERLVDPLLGGINAGNADQLSLRASAPQLLESAASNRSMMRTLRGRQPVEGPVFFSPAGGMAVIIDALIDQLATRGVDLRVESDGRVEGGPTIIATPAAAAAKLLADCAPIASAALANIQHVSVALITIAVPKEAIRHPLDGSGFLVPRVAGTLLTACSWSSMKWHHVGDRSGSDMVMRLSAGRLGDERVNDLDDDQLVQALMAELRPMIGMTGDPSQVRVSRWPNGFPQYLPGHLDRIDELERDLAHQAPHVQLAGAAYRGVGVPACIRSGRQAACKTLEFLAR